MRNKLSGIALEVLLRSMNIELWNMASGNRVEPAELEVLPVAHAQ